MLERTDGGLAGFARVFRSYAFERREGGDPWLARLQLGAVVKLAGDGLADRLADAPEPFWQHVREALLAQREAERAYWEAAEG